MCIGLLSFFSSKVDKRVHEHAKETTGASNSFLGALINEAKHSIGRVLLRASHRYLAVFNRSSRRSKNRMSDKLNHLALPLVLDPINKTTCLQVCMYVGIKNTHRKPWLRHNVNSSYDFSLRYNQQHD